MRSMKKHYLLLFSGLIALVFYTNTVSAAGASAAMLANNCAGCHGLNGVTNGPATPSIAGMTEEYLTLSMQDYKSGVRKSTVMDRIAKGYSDDEIKVMAKYFSDLKYVGLKQKTNNKQTKKGKALAKRYCNSCHEKNGKLADGIGILAGQPTPYLDYTIADFLSGDRPMEKRKRQKMEQLVKDAGEKGFHSVVQFYGSQQ